MNLKSLMCLSMVALLSVPAIGAEDDAKKGKRKGRQGNAFAANRLIKKLEPVGLNEEQMAKIKKLGQSVQKEMKAARTEAGMTAELTKKLTEVQASMKDSELKGKAKTAAIHKAAGLSEQQSAGITAANALRMKFQKDVIAMLSDEQKAKLPKTMTAKGQGKGKGKGKKKQKDAA